MEEEGVSFTEEGEAIFLNKNPVMPTAITGMSDH
jgi:hypothetical protein